jgi:hypothetical protein
VVQRLTDFHTVGGGYDAKKSTYEKLSIPRKASGGASANAVLTQRTYLNEARFIAAFGGDASTIEAAVSHLKNPVWGVWFGRKNCLPAMPLCPVSATDHATAASLLLAQLRQWEELTARPSFPPDLQPADLKRWEEPAGDLLQPGDFHLHDQALRFGEREFTTRPIRHHNRITP